MWGICFDTLICDGKLYQRAVEYEVLPDKGTAYILKPVSGIMIFVEKIEPVDRPPAFVYGEKVSPVSHSDWKGSIRDIIWHFKDNDYNYYISVGGRKKSRRYYSADLRRFPV
ncbi:MAG: hypothetical protein K2P59_12610 [Acetatifactor sp.]|nr:hypothetical protein [Acetatifactor sp.]